ncbi:MAG TPA: hypothetical protein VNO75_00940 [Gemmatimonadaceae bacterium]|nr:hypothetical protein [Gemmatimonadaceae bacterium]
MRSQRTASPLKGGVHELVECAENNRAISPETAVEKTKSPMGATVLKET